MTNHPVMKPMRPLEIAEICRRGRPRRTRTPSSSMVLPNTTSPTPEANKRSFFLEAVKIQDSGGLIRSSLGIVDVLMSAFSCDGIRRRCRDAVLLNSLFSIYQRSGGRKVGFGTCTGNATHD